MCRRPFSVLFCFYSTSACIYQLLKVKKLPLDSLFSFLSPFCIDLRTLQLLRITLISVHCGNRSNNEAGYNSWRRDHLLHTYFVYHAVYPLIFSVIKINNVDLTIS